MRSDFLSNFKTGHWYYQALPWTITALPLDAHWLLLANEVFFRPMSLKWQTVQHA